MAARGAAVVVMLALAAPTGATAQIALGLSATTDLRNRGLSLNGGRPALTASIAYDGPRGVYLGAAASGGDTRSFGARFLGHSEYLGYARAIGTGLTADVGIASTQLGSNVYRRFSGSYRELYVGVGNERFGARVLFSPDYIAPGLRTVYLDVNGGFRLSERWRGFGHVGLLARLGGRSDTVLPRARYDLRGGVAARIARHEVQIAYVRTGAGDAFLGPRRQAADAVILGASWFF